MHAGEHVSAVHHKVLRVQLSAALTATLPTHIQPTRLGTRVRGRLWAVCRIRLFICIDSQIKTRLKGGANR